MEIISWYTIVGLIAQLAFASRMLVQWILSEKAKQIVNPALFWWLSLAGSLMMSFYGFLREDFAILLGQFISYYVYIYNLKLKRELQQIGKIVTTVIILLPLIFIALQVKDFHTFFGTFLDGNVTVPLLIFGLVGQFLFTFRFIYQMIISHRSKQSVLPVAFWYISLLAAIMVQVYGLFRLDIVLILGQVGGMVTYIRNIMLDRKVKKSKENSFQEQVLDSEH